MKRINRLSDFTLTVALKNSEGEHITPPSTPWEIHIADAAGTCWRCSFDGTNYEDCAVVDEQIICFVDNPGFVACAARITFHNNVPDDNFGDGVYNQVVPLTDEVYFYDGPTDNDGEIETSLILEYFSAQEHNYVTEEELDADLQQLTAEVAATYATKTQVEGMLSKDELGTEVAKYTQLAVHFTGGPNNGVWRYYDGAKNLLDIIAGTAEESTLAEYLVSLAYKMQGLDIIKPVVVDIVCRADGTPRSVDYIPFVGLLGSGTALFSALGNSADDAADATDIVSVHYFLDTERQSWQRAEMDFANHIFELESSVSGLERMKADKTQLADYLTTSAAATTYLSKSEAQSTYMTEGEVNAKNITAVCVTVQGSITWKYIEGVFDAADLLSGQTLGNEITLKQFIQYCSDYLMGSTELRIVVVEGVVNGTTPEISNVLPLVSYPYPSRTDTFVKFACVGYPIRSNAAPANSCSLISYTLGDDGFGNWEWTRYEYDIDTLLAAKANTADVASTYATIAAMNAGLADKADKVAVTNVVPQTGMLPNVVYNLGTTDTVNITLATPTDNTVANIYCFTFTAQTAACTVTLPSNVELGNEYSWEFESGRKYEVSIYDNIALVAYADATNNS